MPRLSIRWKLTLWYGLILALLLGTFSATVCWTMRHQLLQRIDQGLAEELADVRFEIERASDARGLSMWLERRFARHEGFDFQITRQDGSRFFVNERIADQPLPLPPQGIQPGYETVTPERNPSASADEPESSEARRGAAGGARTSLRQAGRWRVVSVQVRGPEGPLTVQVARSLATFEQESRELLWAFLLAGPLTVFATLVGGYFLARQTLAPVQRMTETARQISSERLDRRVPVTHAADELGQLAATLNAMLDGLERSFAEMRRFTADAAHELRTPLAVIRNEAEVALRSPRSSAEYGRVLENVLEETVRLSRMADELLFLCRQDAGLNLQASEPVALDPLLEEVADNMRQVAQEKGVQLTLEAGSGCTVSGDGRQFRRVFYNLIDNAVKYTPAGGQVQVSCRRDGGEVVVTVADTGIGIPSEHLPRIFDRFYCVDPARTGDGGAGLGLSICQSIVRCAGGAIATRAGESKGTVFEVRLAALNP